MTRETGERELIPMRFLDLSPEQVVNEALMFWFDNHGADAILYEEKVQRWLAADPRRTREGWYKMRMREWSKEHRKTA